MSGVIHHGPPGSFKSSNVLMLQAIKALQAGRVVVTNVRGFNSLDKINKAYSFKEPLPDTAEILHIDTKGKQAKFDMACWFHWAPKGALIIIDEAQMIYPSKRKDFKLENLDYKGGADQAAIDDRPADFMEAFDMHRHHNWDIYLCTPNIAKIHSEIRQVCDVAFRHYAIGNLIPWKKGRWREVEHDPEFSGKATSHAYGSPKEYKIDARIFECYDSTTTGKHQEGSTQNAFYKDKRIIAIFTVFGLAISAFAYNVSKIYQRETSRGEVVEMAGEEALAGSSNVSDSSIGFSSNQIVSSVDNVIDHPLFDVKLSITASYVTGFNEYDYSFLGVDDIGSFHLNTFEIENFGYHLQSVNSCYAVLSYLGVQVSSVYCSRRYIDEDNSIPDSLTGDFNIVGIGGDSL